MAQLTFTINEVLELLETNDLKHERLSDLRLEGNVITVVINTGLPFPKTVKADVEYIDLTDGKLKLELKANPMVAKLVDMLSMPQNIEYNSPFIFVDLNGFIAKKLKGLSVSKVVMENNQITVVTEVLQAFT